MQITDDHQDRVTFSRCLSFFFEILLGKCLLFSKRNIYCSLVGFTRTYQNNESLNTSKILLQPINDMFERINLIDYSVNFGR